MNFILFGPPGVGKSTLIAILKSQGLRAIDLEDVYPSKVRFALPNQLSDVVIGAADLNPKRSYPNASKILLYATQEAYNARRSARDAKVSGKATQQQHLVSDWMKGVNWDLTIDTSSLSADQTAARIRSFIGQRGGRSNG